MIKSAQQEYAEKVQAENEERLRALARGSRDEAPKPANEMAILRRVLKALEPLDWAAKLRVLDYVRSAAASSEQPQPSGGFNNGLTNQWAPR